MVVATETAWAAVSSVSDPELPPLTIADLGVLRGVDADASGRIIVRITPTYSGCPAMTVIQMEIETALAKAGIKNARVETELAPAWSSADISAEGRAPRCLVYVVRVSHLQILSGTHLAIRLSNAHNHPAD